MTTKIPLLLAVAGMVAAGHHTYSAPPQHPGWNVSWTTPNFPALTCASSTHTPTYSQNSSWTFPTTAYPGIPSAVSPEPSRTQYAVAYTEVSALFSNVSTTSWPNWTPAATLVTPTANADPFGVAAYSALWNAANPSNFSRGLYSTTASPTPIPTNELVKPPPLYFKPQNCYQFPKDFILGAAGSAAQCEGAIADQGKSPSFLDMIFNLLSLGGSQSQLANDAVVSEHYYLYKRDIDRLAAAGMKYFYFTIAWTRILPFALPGTPVNSFGLAHYNDVIDYVVSKGMVPAVALTHFDTPLQFYGGGAEYLTQTALATSNATYGLDGASWAYENATFEDAFVHYAQIALAHFADRVPIWITFNEPQIGSVNAAAVTNVLRAHARTYRYYKDVLKGTGQMTIKMGIAPGVPLDASNASHIEAAEFFTDLYVFPYLYPTVFGQQYPEAFLKTIADAQPLTKNDLELMNGTMDFIALDVYAAQTIAPAVGNLTACATNHTASPLRHFPICVISTTTDMYGWATGYSPAGSSAHYMAPLGVRSVLNYVWNHFGKPIAITEFGLELPVPPGGRLKDNLFNVPQSEFLLSYLNEMLTAIWEDGVHVMGAFVWNFLDSWEFGTEDRGFGLMYLNWTTQERRYRRSIFDVVDFVESRRQS